ncbi:MAG: FAD-dependent oxidoreductase [Chloracidobacterium sp.]|nr:FAD-dependent oxidoreductase [Chloracidobacterium sp.]
MRRHWPGPRRASAACKLKNAGWEVTILEGRSRAGGRVLIPYLSRHWTPGL